MMRFWSTRQVKYIAVTRRTDTVQVKENSGEPA